MNKKLRLSYSLISTWEKGDTKGAVDLYFHVDRKASKQMEDGKEYHKEIAEHINKFNRLPDYMNFNLTFKMPEPEKEVVVEYNELFNLKGVFDCFDNPDLFEFKTGVSDSLEWARTWQLPFYFLIAEINKTPVERAFLIRHNQYKKETDFAVIHNSQRLRDQARNVVDTVGPDIYTYFTDQGLL